MVVSISSISVLPAVPSRRPDVSGSAEMADPILVSSYVPNSASRDFLSPLWFSAGVPGSSFPLMSLKPIKGCVVSCGRFGLKRDGTGSSSRAAPVLSLVWLEQLFRCSLFAGCRASRRSGCGGWCFLTGQIFGIALRVVTGGGLTGRFIDANGRQPSGHR